MQELTRSIRIDCLRSGHHHDSPGWRENRLHYGSHFGSSLGVPTQRAEPCYRSLLHSPLTSEEASVPHLVAHLHVHCYIGPQVARDKLGEAMKEVACGVDRQRKPRILGHLVGQPHHVLEADALLHALSVVLRSGAALPSPRCAFVVRMHPIHEAQHREALQACLEGRMERRRRVCVFEARGHDADVADRVCLRGARDADTDPVVAGGLEPHVDPDVARLHPPHSRDVHIKIHNPVAVVKDGVPTVGVVLFHIPHCQQLNQLVHIQKCRVAISAVLHLISGVPRIRSELLHLPVTHMFEDVDENPLPRPIVNPRERQAKFSLTPRGGVQDRAICTAGALPAPTTASLAHAVDARLGANARGLLARPLHSRAPDTNTVALQSTSHRPVVVGVQHYGGDPTCLSTLPAHPHLQMQAAADDGRETELPEVLQVVQHQPFDGIRPQSCSHLHLQPLLLRRLLDQHRPISVQPVQTVALLRYLLRVPLLVVAVLADAASCDGGLFRRKLSGAIDRRDLKVAVHAAGRAIFRARF
mmetsp:Transcript_134092/g.428463  ORF Transcript_134092/g.428463 Transcript_134092/m.428463 type:complete len:529 (+) Transcript_134092:4322-5908(+)